MSFMSKQAGNEKHTCTLGDSSGQAIVEAALMMLLLFVFIFAIFEAGRMIQVQQTLTDAAREGARLSVAPLTQTLPGTMASDSDIIAFVQSYLAAASLNASGANSAVERPVTGGTTTYTRVTVTYPYKVMTLLMFGNLNMTLTGKSLMRNETSQ